MTEKSILRPASQEERLQSFPLLRRPRPPPQPVQKPCRGAFSNEARRRFAGPGEKVPGTFGSGLQEKLGSVSTPLHPLPRHHPTPTSPHRHPSSSRRLHHHPNIREEDSSDQHHVGGPPPFPQRKSKTHRGKRCSTKQKSDRKERKVPDIEEALSPEPEVDDNEFAPLFSDLDEAEEAALYEPPRTRLREKVLSRQNYLKLTGWFATHIPRQDTLNTMILTVDHSVPNGRKPHHQMLLELEAMVSVALAESRRAGTEEEGGRERQQLLWPSPNPGDIVFRSSTSRYFCGEGRSNSPFDSGDQPLISPSEVAILESMLEGGFRLSLKAHFLVSLPPLSPLSLTLTCLNLSFNGLRVFPAEILELTQLRVLRMRNNPVQHIPNDIKWLEKLEDFCISFNALTSLPSGLFELPSLQTLDVSHNSIQHLSRNISKLRTLQRLNVESNELIGLPPSLLSLPLTHLHISGNYLHPFLWRENCRSPPQALVDMCCTVVNALAMERDEGLPYAIREIIDCRRSPCDENLCDFCRGPIFGPGLKVVRSTRPAKNFRFPLTTSLRVPVLYRACSQTCARTN